MGRRIRRAAVLVVFLAALVPGVAEASRTPTEVTSNTHFDEPSLALDGAGRSHVAYIAYGDGPGLILATDATGAWVSTRITTARDEAPAIAVDKSGADHIAFVRYGSDAGLYYATDRTGDWVVTRLAKEPADAPSIALDGDGHVHIAFASGSFDPGIVALDDTTGSWVRTQVTRAPLDGSTSIVVLPDGSSKIAFARYAPEGPGIYVAASGAAGGSWSLDRLTKTYDDEPSMVVRSADEVDVAFIRFESTGRGLYDATGSNGTWSIAPLSVDSARYYDRPSMAIDVSGLATIVYSLASSTGDPLGLFAAREAADGSWRPDVPVTSQGRSDDWPSLGLDTDGRAHVAFAESDIGPNPGVYVHDAVTFDLIAGSTVDSDVSMTVAADGHQIAFKRLSDGSDRGIRSGRDANGTWKFETASKDPAAPSVVVDDAWHSRIFTRDLELSDATDAWAPSTLGLAGVDVRASVDPDGHHWLAYQQADATPMIASDLAGRWETASDYFGFDGKGAVAVGPDGRIHWVIAGDTLAYETAMSLDGPWSEKGLGSQATDPGIAVDGAGKVHIVWRRVGSDEGTYYTTNASGAWVTTRLTRTSAEGAPAMALDGTGHVYVAVVRAARAADPGVYLVSNRSGDWVTTRIEGAFDAMDPQLAVDPAGHATVVLGRDHAGLVALEATAFAPVTASGRSARLREIDIGPERVRVGDRSGSTEASGPATVPHDHSTGSTP